jgi:hypothetical protein
MHNRNNVTRTAAYWRIYAAHPELHWALLAHLVSRNGGWCMTDLKGEWLPGLMSPHLINVTFGLLESCNSLIFGDAYPQLRLYEESRRQGRSLHALLPHFGVSAFMTPYWEQFWSDRDSVTLSAALIVNEQNFIQSRVVEDGKYKRELFRSTAFRSQPLLQLNQIVFPIERPGVDTLRSRPLRLAGRVLENFEDIRERIEFGKSLYAMLFGYPAILLGAVSFAQHTPHSGSRADYWPQRFTKMSPNANGRPESTGSAASVRASLWYSPPLAEAWADRTPIPASEGDWFDDPKLVSYLSPLQVPRIVDMTHEHLFGQHKLQAAVLLERSFMNGANNRRTGRG